MTSEILPAAPAFFYGFEASVVEVTLHEPVPARRIPEALVQDLWQHQRFDRSGLYTTAGERIVVIDPGRPNRDSGPDFREARLQIGGTRQHGDVEIHVTSGGWLDHRHHHDARYNGVVLHVTLHADVWTGSLVRADGTAIPELVLYPHLEAPVRTLLHRFYVQQQDELLCAGGWHRVPEAIRTAWIRRMADERIRAKRDELAAAYLRTPDLEQLLHERLFAGLGYAKNTEAMRMLARRIPLALARRIDDPLDLEAMHLGAAGLLPAPRELLGSDRATADHVMELRGRFERLQAQYDISVMERTSWRFFRLRPANFPPLRIAQAAALLRPGGLLHRDPIGTLASVFSRPEPHAALHALLMAPPLPFWNNHVRLEKATRPYKATLGRGRADVLVVNAIVPTLLVYAEQAGDTALESAVLDVLRSIPAAEDEVTRHFTALGVPLRDALTAQGLHQLYRTRCSKARCLSCAIGKYLLDSG